MKKTLLIIAGSALATGLAIKAAPAFSQPTPSEINVSVVHTSDLDLSNRLDQRRLDRRLAIAAGEVCGEASDWDLKGQNEVRKCRQDALASARLKARAIIAQSAKTPILVASNN